MQSGMYFPPYGDTIGSIVVKHVNGQLVDVISGRIYPACVNFFEGKVVRIEHKVSAPPQYLLPGLIDSHIHVESSLLTPYRFAEQAVAHGTTAVVADPSPVGRMAGVGAVEFMQRDARSTPLHFYWAAPSSLPASTGFDWKGVKNMLGQKECVALGEVMEIAKVLGEDPDIISKMEVARQFGKPIDGHSPGLRGYDLDRYIMAGVSSDHECVSAGEAEEKSRRGMTIAVKDGTAFPNLGPLAAFAKGNHHLLATDYIGPNDLLSGHMDAVLRKAVALGVDPVQAIRAATMWPAERYGLPGGSLYVGGPADLTVVSDLKEFRPLETWIGGELVAKDGVPLFMGNPDTFGTPFVRPPVEPSALVAKAAGKVAKVKVVEIGPRSLGWGEGRVMLPVQDGRVLPDPDSDIALLALVDPAGDLPLQVGFVRGFGVTSGAVASSNVYGSRGVIAVGVDEGHLAEAVNTVLSMGGGIAVVSGAGRATLALPIAGMMSSLPAADVARGEQELVAAIRSMGSSLPDPLMSLAFLGTAMEWMKAPEQEDIRMLEARAA